MTVLKLSDQFLATYGVQFNSESSKPYVAVVNLGGGHATSGVNGIGGVDVENFLSYATAIRIRFFIPPSSTTRATTDFVSIRGDTGSNGGWVRLEAFDEYGALVASDVQNHGPPAVLSVSRPGIHSVRISQENGKVALDDLTFSTPLASMYNNHLSIEVSQVRLCWNAETTKTYQPQYRSELTTNQWADFGPPIPGNGERQCLTDQVTEPRRFYRLVILP